MRVTVSRLVQGRDEFLTGVDGSKIEFPSEEEATEYLKELGINETTIASFKYHKD